MEKRGLAKGPLPDPLWADGATSFCGAPGAHAGCDKAGAISLRFLGQPQSAWETVGLDCRALPLLY